MRIVADSRKILENLLTIKYYNSLDDVRICDLYDRRVRITDTNG